MYRYVISQPMLSFPPLRITVTRVDIFINLNCRIVLDEGQNVRLRRPCIREQAALNSIRKTKRVVK